MNPEYYLWIAKECLKQAYSPRIANSFHTIQIMPGIKAKKECVQVECFNGRAFIQFRIYTDNSGIRQTGDYSIHTRINPKRILRDAKTMFNQIEK